jgi:hypothetical protein
MTEGVDLCLLSGYGLEGTKNVIFTIFPNLRNIHMIIVTKFPGRERGRGLILLSGFYKTGTKMTPCSRVETDFPWSRNDAIDPVLHDYAHDYIEFGILHFLHG